MRDRPRDCARQANLRARKPPEGWAISAYRLTNPNTRPPSKCIDSKSSFAEACVTYRQLTATRTPACASLSDPRAVSNRARALPPVQPKPSARFKTTELMARRSCEARSRSLRLMASISGRDNSTTSSECSKIDELFGLCMPTTGAACVPTESRQLRCTRSPLARKVRRTAGTIRKAAIGTDTATVTVTGTATATATAGRQRQR